MIDCPSEINRLFNIGIAGPFNLSTLSLVNAFNASSEKETSFRNIHHTNSYIAEIFKDLNLVKAVRSLFGVDYLLWRSNIFAKSVSSGTEVRWHHDKHFQDGSSELDFDELGQHISILIALDDTHSGNGPFEFLPASHKSLAGFDRDIRPYHLKPATEHFASIPQALAQKSYTLTMKKGQFALFHSALMHRTTIYKHGPPRRNLVGRLSKKGVAIPSALLDINQRPVEFLQQ